MVQKKLSPEEEEDAKIINRVSDLKKKKMKMKKSASIKRPELCNFSSTKHAKPPPCTVATPPQRPNYMKPTTSSDARKEQSPPTAARTHDIVSTMHRTKLALVSANKGAKTSSSSIKMRSLTKNPSFKPARGGSVRKCSAAVVLCEDSDAKRATCSSTLKHCKFPSYLSLNDGGTESEGTSSIKVCPYTYCSLNGHHREPLPPLKLFLSARRRVVKAAQRSVKLGCLSPRRVKGSNEMEGLRVASPVEEEQRDFFIEIYGERNEDGADYSHEGDESYDLCQEDQQERALEEPICYEDDVAESLDRDGSMSLMDVKDDGEISPTSSVLDKEERSELGCLSELPVESVPNVDDSNESDCEASDYEVEYSYGTKVEPDPDLGEGFVIKSDSKGGCFDEFLVDEVYDEQSLNSDAFYNSDCDDESTSSYDYLQGSNHTLFDEETTSFDGLKHNPKEDAIAAMEDQDGAITSAEEGCKIQTELSEENHHQISHNKNSTTLITPMDPVKEPQNECWSTFKKPVNEDDDEMGLFDPRGPNFLPLEPDPDGEKVDLRHQDLDERKNAEEWMVDYALRQVVTKLGPARKKRVALLVEAFEKVMPETKWGFDQARPIQACS